MKKFLFLYLIFVLSVFSAFAQYSDDPDMSTDPNPEYVGRDSAQQKLKEISVVKFEDTAYWKPYISYDNGYITTKRFEGSPLNKEPIEDEEKNGIEDEDKFVLGVKVNYLKRGAHDFFINSARPINIPGIVKTLSVWVVGRNTNHTISVLFKDYYGRDQEIFIGKLNFAGWKKLTVAIPPGIAQRDSHYISRNGLQFVGFRIDCDIKDTYGYYYIYFDDLRAVTDLFDEESTDIDDMTDGW